jgi:hypothetical protein
MAEREPLKYKPGDKLECFDMGQWFPCVILSVASYAGKSGPGYYASYDPVSDRCRSFWTNDRMLRERESAICPFCRAAIPTGAAAYRDHCLTHHGDGSGNF